MTPVPEPTDFATSVFNKVSRLRHLLKNKRRKNASKAQRNRALATLPHAQLSLPKSVLECCNALNYFVGLTSVSRDLGTDLDEAKEQAGTLRECLVAVCILGRTNDEWIGKDTQLVVTALVFLLSAILVHMGYLLHNRWLYVGMENKWRDYKWVTESLDSLLGITVPWGFSASRSYTMNIHLTDNQRQHCRKIISRGHFDELQRLLSAINRRPYWRKLRWSQNQPMHSRQVLQHVTLLVNKIALVCKREQWEVLIFQVPTDSSINKDTLSGLLASADSHLEDIKLKLNLTVDSWIGDRSDKFKFRDEDMKLAKWTANDGSWFDESEHYRLWCNAGPGTNGRFLWCLGIIGMGKSFLMHASVERQKRQINNTSPQRIIVELYFHQDAPASFEEVMMEISHQVLTYTKGPTNFTTWLYDRLTRNLATDTKENLLYMMLQELMTSFDVYFFLDGLDELEENFARGLVNMLMLLGQTHRIICFSRRCSAIREELFPNFKFWELQSREADLKGCLERVLPMLEDHVGTMLPPDAKPNLLRRVTNDSQGSYLLLAGQVEFIMTQTPPKYLLPLFGIIPDAAFPRYRATMSRIKSVPIRGERQFLLIAWVCVLRTLSIAEALPHLKPRLPVRDPAAIRRMVDDSYGILHIVDGNITFTNYVAEAFVCAEFADLFPEFVAKVRGAARRPSKRHMPKPLMDGFDHFMATRYGRHKLLIRDLEGDLEGDLDSAYGS